MPEIYQGIVEIKEISREVGGRTKIAVYSRDESIDPVGACVGLKGSRVQAVVSELGGERIDIVPWHPDTEVFARRALAPARVSKVFSDPERQVITAIVDEDQLSLAIGRNGQNVRLASQLIGWQIDLYGSREWLERGADLSRFQETVGRPVRDGGFPALGAGSDRRQPWRRSRTPGIIPFCKSSTWIAGTSWRFPGSVSRRQTGSWS